MGTLPGPDYDPEANLDEHGELADRARIAHVDLRFYFAVDSLKPWKKAVRAGWDGAEGRYMALLEEVAAPELTDSTFVARAAPPRFATGGPMPAQTDYVWLLGFANDVVGAAVNLAASAVLVRALTRKLTEATGNSLRVSDGVAVVLASAEVEEKLEERDLTLAFATRLSAHRPDTAEGDDPFDSWLVGFRTPSRLVIVEVSYAGRARLLADDVAIALLADSDEGG